MAADCQSLLNTLTAVQDLALAEAARRESVWCEDGTLGETVHGPGRVTLDAADLAAPVLGASHAQAQLRVEQAVRLAAGRVPVEADGAAPPEASGLHGAPSGDAARARLDGYRAGVVALRARGRARGSRRCGRHRSRPRTSTTTPRHCADALGAWSLASRPTCSAQRAERARTSTGLRRWVVRTGRGRLVRHLPQRGGRRRLGRHRPPGSGAGHRRAPARSVEQARGRALTDLVTGKRNGRRPCGAHRAGRR